MIWFFFFLSIKQFVLLLNCYTQNSDLRYVHLTKCIINNNTVQVFFPLFLAKLKKSRFSWISGWLLRFLVFYVKTHTNTTDCF